MSIIEDAIKQIVIAGKEEVFIKCVDKRNQESTRVMLYNLKRKMVKVAEEVGISKITDPDGQLFVRVYKRPILELYETDENGNMVLIKAKPEDDPILQRQLKFMREDGVGEEEIENVIKEWRKKNDKKTCTNMR